MLDNIVVAGVSMMPNERCKLELALGVSIRGRRRMPHFYAPSETDCKMPPRRRKGKGGY